MRNQMPTFQKDILHLMTCKLSFCNLSYKIHINWIFIFTLHFTDFWFINKLKDSTQDLSCRHRELMFVRGLWKDCGRTQELILLSFELHIRWFISLLGVITLASIWHLYGYIFVITCSYQNLFHIGEEMIYVIQINIWGLIWKIQSILYC